MKVTILASGGLDSVCLISKAIQEKKEPTLIFFNYGQKNYKKELKHLKKFIKSTNKKIDILIKKINLDFEMDFLKGKIKTEKKTWVPLRNLIFLSLGGSFSINAKIKEIWLGSTKEDIFPDNDKQFGMLFNKLLDYSSYKKIKLVQPFLKKIKSQMINECKNFDLSLSWSCYQNKNKQCGTCKSCLERKKAFKKSEKRDLTKYLNIKN